ncbi:(2Fe-2S)-binding protein [Agitococcus lubricus]|uniref:Bacterioferritin-associated ferredoxin n=1 Tax=Agitococcus lubricus TaxID=1077255 RepID=A0A2T5J2E2_9GAMM|nr:(2Fe-2S)-binding protein [Agitococcus lubricus]PTQ90693.1 bacterioferritin-associated ferredoxin [Agitococcus lubricus]
MFVCVCHAVTDKQIKQAVEAGCCSYREVRDCLQTGTTCGRCVPETRELINATLIELAPHTSQAA